MTSFIDDEHNIQLQQALSFTDLKGALVYAQEYESQNQLIFNQSINRQQRNIHPIPAITEDRITSEPW